MNDKERLELAEEYKIQGNGYIDKGEYDNAIKAYKKAIELKPDDADAYNNLGIAYSNKGEYDNAIKAYNKAIELKPDFADAYYNLGIAYDDKGEYDNAIKACKKAIELKPDYANAYNGLGIAYSNKGEYDNAITAYKKAIELKPDDANAYNNLGNAYGKKGEYDNAIKAFKKAIELNLDDAYAYYNLGTAYGKKGDYDNAIKACNKTIELKPDYAEAYNNLGVAYDNKSEYDNAIKAFNKAIELKPDYANAYNGLGIAYSNKGEYDNAIKAYKKAIELKPDFADAYYGLGVAYRNKGDYDNAIKAYNKAIELNPDYADVYLNRGNLYNYLLNNNIIIEEIAPDRNKIFTDWNTYIYLSRDTGKLTHVDTLVKFFELYPQTVLTILEYSNINPDNLLFNIFEDAQESVADFIQLLQLYENVIPDKTKVLSIKSVLHYYLGGAVSSYIIFDEQLDTGDYTLSSQEYYYYALTAKEINREAEAILDNAINEISNKTDKTAEDFYYLAHLYLLQGNEEKAIENFKQSDNFIFSVIMLACKSEDRSYIKQAQNINPADIYNFSTEIDYTRKDLSQFQHFFHICECKVANSFDKSISQFLSPDKYNDSFWEIFKLSDKKKKAKLEDDLRKIAVTNILKDLQEKFADVFKKSGEKISIVELNDYLVNYYGDMQDEFDFVEKGSMENRDYANQIGLSIYRWRVKKPEFYVDLIQFYYLEKKIDSKVAFTLYFYLLYIFKKKNGLHLSKADLFFEISKIFVPNVGIKFFLIASKTGWKILDNILNGYEKYNKDNPDLYQNFKDDFKNNFWEYIVADKERLSDSEFERKYRYFEWFENEKL